MELLMSLNDLPGSLQMVLKLALVTHLKILKELKNIF